MSLHPTHVDAYYLAMGRRRARSWKWDTYNHMQYTVVRVLRIRHSCCSFTVLGPESIIGERDAEIIIIITLYGLYVFNYR